MNTQLLGIFAGCLNDMWMFNLNYGLWMWLSGTNMVNQVGSYGIKGGASASNQPGGRYDHAMNIHPSGKIIFLFGGYGYDSAAISGAPNSFKISNYLPANILGYLNDMWAFDFTSSSWKWTSGSKETKNAGIYGIQGSASPINQPGSRSCHSMVIDPTGQFIYVFGGTIYETNFGRL